MTSSNHGCFGSKSDACMRRLFLRACLLAGHEQVRRRLKKQVSTSLTKDASPCFGGLCASKEEKTWHDSTNVQTNNAGGGVKGNGNGEYWFCVTKDCVDA